MRLRFRLVLSTAALLMLSGCGALSNMSIDESNADVSRLACYQDLTAEVDRLAVPFLKQKAIPGLVVGVLTADGNRRSWGYGFTDSHHGYPITGDTLFAVGSVSKGFMAETTGILVKRGIFRWENTLEELLPRQIPLSDSAKKITLLQLVTHTSGLPRQMMDMQMLGLFAEYLFTGNNFYTLLDDDRVLDYLADFTVPAHPTPTYSNLGYAILGYILQLKTGQSIDQLVNETIIEPLRLESTSFTPQKLTRFPYRAIGHAGDQPKFIMRGKPIPDWHFSSNMVGAASLYTSANDLLKFARAHLYPTGHHALDEAINDSMKTYYNRTKQAANIAWITDEVGTQYITYQVGYIGGYSSYIGLDRHNRIAVVVLQNSFNWDNNLGHTLISRIGQAMHYQGVCKV
ncbi:serine hydrolase domain-containing protein [Pectobacterium wasabiae]|uniref:Beta-lactamase n=1 Tax=Pectobacterium wasabiae TaxID=55208 RepID=A0AAW3EFT4_9GAMM|nr:serine hydrolase domain-containing protein [Pectobacterium wasabiae]AOR63254.1 serine hydrolase [Pectobacterium wasabiae CFBP 3304]EJS96167.1 Beta-lactamase AmpC [Pectobacterium wasabiae CFBP 3304]KFX04246.1 beta-lactamase [Pectobacterium wasabiae]KGA27380.1 beta-lactamase [Pectobacterium wasabiae]